MAETNGPDLLFIGLFASTSLTYSLHHVWRFDRFRCLAPRRREWFRGLLIWMLLFSNIALIIWAAGWGYVRYSLGWVRLGPFEARPWPSALFPPNFQSYNTPLTVLLGAAYGMLASLNAEEGLYWMHLMQAVRNPQAAVPFLKSAYFKAWIAITILLLAIQQAAPWIGHNGDLMTQLAIELLVAGILEFGVLISSLFVVLKFPQFLVDVKNSGAGPEVRTKLHFFHESNKVRTLFRLTFSVPLIILGADGLTDAMTINLNPLGTDFLASLIGLSISVVSIISVILYLPIAPPSSRQNKVMVGQQPPHIAHGTSGFALMSLMRDGGQWDGVDEDLASEAGIKRPEEAPFANTESRGTSWGPDGEERPHGRGYAKAAVPTLLDTFTSPIAVSAEAQPQRPVQVLVHVERAVHKD